MVAMQNRVLSPSDDRVELAWVTSLGQVRFRIVLWEGRLWIDARAAAVGLPDPFCALEVVLDLGDVREICVDGSGVLMAADQVASEEDVEAMREMFCLLVAAKGVTG